MVVKIPLSYYEYESKQESEGLNPGQQCSVQNIDRVNFLTTATQYCGSGYHLKIQMVLFTFRFLHLLQMVTSKNISF